MTKAVFGRSSQILPVSSPATYSDWWIWRRAVSIRGQPSSTFTMAHDLSQVPMAPPESVTKMANYLLQDIEQARRYAKRKLRQVVCTPLDTLTDDYLREKGWTVEAIFPPIPGLVLDAPAKANSLIVVIKRPRQ